jgi:hypothetical protein
MSISDLSRPTCDLRLGRSAIAIVLVLCGAACRTREDAARRAGREAALLARHDCVSDAGLAEECRASICRDRCAAFADSVTLTETCTTKCTGKGTCDSDADCDKALICRMIAPRLRRCETPRDVDAEPF